MVTRQLPKLKTAGSSPVIRSTPAAASSSPSARLHCAIGIGSP